RSVHGKGGWTPRVQVAPQLHQRTRPAPRGRPPRRAEAKARQDARNPLAIEVLAGDHDDAAIAEVVQGGKDAAVPEREDGLVARGDDLVEVAIALDAPGQRPAERR